MIFLKIFNKKNIRFRFLIMIVLIFALSTLTLSLFIVYNEKKMFEYSLKSKGEAFASYIAKLSKEPLLSRDSMQLDSIVHDASRDEDILYVLIFNAEDDILTSQYASINYRSSQVYNAIFSGTNKQINGDLIEWISFLKKKEAMIEISIPIKFDIKTIGRVVVGLSKYRIHQKIIQTSLFIGLINGFIAFFMGSILFLISRRMILDPIIEMSRVAHCLSEGNMNVRVKIDAGGEMQELAKNFNSMIDNLDKKTISKNYFEKIIKSLMDCLIVLNENRKISMINLSSCQLLGDVENQLLNLTFDQFLYDEKLGQVLVSEIYEKGFVRNLETFLKTKSGEKKHVLFSAALISDDKNRNSVDKNIVIVIKDISDIKKMEQQLYLSAKLASLGTLAAGVAHEINNPLMVILGYSQ